MKLSDKEASVKMAGLCGYETDIIGDEVMIIIGQSKYKRKFLKKWNPRENIAQMMEVVEAWRSLDDLNHYMVSSPKDQACINYFDIDLYAYDSDGFVYVVSSQEQILLEAIFQAVKKWMESEG